MLVNCYLVNTNLLSIWYISLFCKSSFFLTLFLFCLILYIINKKLQFLKIILTTRSTQLVYECGFQPFSKLLQFYDINFFIIAILFLIFDLELIFLFPLVFIFKYGLFN